MSRDGDRGRDCPRCAARVSPQRFEGDVDGTVTWRWRCACGWAGILTESGVVDRDLVARRLGRKTIPTPTR